MKNSNQSVSKAASIGLLASKILSKDQNAQVFGNTSRGIFIKTSGKWLVFLSFEQFRGPLTITFDKIDPVLRHVTYGNPVRIASLSILLPLLNMMIKIEGSEVWQPEHLSALPLGNSERHEMLVYFANEILSKKNGVGLVGLIPPLLGIPNPHRPLETNNGFGWAEIQQLQNYIRNREAAPLAMLLSTNLGSGSGLTPSADDFAVGLLLALNRWQNLLWPADRLRDLNHQVVEAAYEKTTTLSANLIECATLGLADERLINALDWIMTGVAGKPEITDHLLGWGHSSGVDAFVGMAAALCVD